MKTINLSNSQYDYLLLILDRYSSDLSNNCCNDLDEEVENLFNRDGPEIAEDCKRLNNPENPEGPDWPVQDFVLVDWLRNQIQESALDV